MITENVGVNVGVNVDVNKELAKIEIKILEEIIKDPQITALDVSSKIGKSKRTAERYIKSLHEKGYIVREGSDKKGNWKIIK